MVKNNEVKNEIVGGPLAEYFERIRERYREGGADAMRCSVWRLVRSTERHFDRFGLAERRYERAARSGDEEMIGREREIMHALLYEAVDTVYMVLNILDPDGLEVRPSLDGVGLSGEDAIFVDQTLNQLERIASRVLSYAKEYKLPLDFQRAVDEVEGVTYTQHCHWRDFVPGSAEESFFAYFADVQRALALRLMQVSKLWHKSVQQLLLRPKRRSLAAVTHALLLVSFPAAEGLPVEHERIHPVRRHFLPPEILVGGRQGLST